MLTKRSHVNKKKGLNLLIQRMCTNLKPAIFYCL